MEILFVTPELSPISGDGPLARVSSALPKALRGLDHRVTVVSPLYRGIDPVALQLARRLTRLELDVGGETHACELYDGRTSAGVELLFIGHEGLFGSAGHMEEGDEATVARRAGLFGRAAAGLVETREPRPEVLHGLGWPGALAVTRAHGNVATVLTVPELTTEGRFPPALAGDLGIPEALRGPAGAEHEGRVVPVKAAFLQADRVTTGSPAYAREVREGREGAGLSAVVADLGDRFIGVPHGVDGAVWNPATDAHLPSRFDPMDLRGKRRCKADLQQAAGLQVRADVCVVGCLGRGGEDEGLDLLAEAAPDVLRNDVQLVVRAPDGQPGLAGLQALSERFPDRLAVLPAPDETEAHRLIAGADLLAVPHRRAPHGELAMQAHRYGTLPVVRRVSAHADAVVDCDAQLRTGSGFVFDEASATELGAALARALVAFTRGEAFTALQQRAMRIDHSWERSARLYDREYRLALGVED
ncbi:MAG: glycogen synthase [Myxococcota bacterium]